MNPEIMHAGLDPDVQLGDNDKFLFIRYMTFKHAGDQEPQHSHQFGHYTSLFKGRALFKVEGRLVEKQAPALVWIEANSQHQITALEDDTQCACIHYRGNFPNL